MADVFTWTGATSNSYTVTTNWLQNGGTAARYPGTGDSVVFPANPTRTFNGTATAYNYQDLTMQQNSGISLANVAVLGTLTLQTATPTIGLLRIGPISNAVLLNGSIEGATFANGGTISCSGSGTINLTSTTVAADLSGGVLALSGTVLVTIAATSYNITMPSTVTMNGGTVSVSQPSGAGVYAGTLSKLTVGDNGGVFAMGSESWFNPTFAVSGGKSVALSTGSFWRGW